MPCGPPPRSSEGTNSARRWNRWNLLLLVPLLVLATPLYNSDEPRLLGFPFFYWVQFMFIPLGVICVALVYLMTGDRG